jgi:hypothetical protein
MGGEPGWRPALLSIVGIQDVAAGAWESGDRLLDEALAPTEQPHPIAELHALTNRVLADTGMPGLAALTERAHRAREQAAAAGSAFWEMGGHLACAAAASRAGDRAGIVDAHAAVAAITARSMGRALPPNAQQLEASLALFDARFADAEQLAGEVLVTTDPLSLSFLNASAQLAAAFYWTGRDEELLAGIGAFFAEQRPALALVELVRVSVVARRGERDPVYDEYAADGFAAIPMGWNRVGCLCHAGYAAAWLGERGDAAVLEPLLAPFAGELLSAVFGVLIFDAADSVRGMLLTTLGRYDEAVACHEAAADLCERAEGMPWAVMNAHRLARALALRHDPGDRDRARALATETADRAAALGMVPDARFAREVLQLLGE